MTPLQHLYKHRATLLPALLAHLLEARPGKRDLLGDLACIAACLVPFLLMILRTPGEIVLAILAGFYLVRVLLSAVSRRPLPWRWRWVFAFALACWAWVIFTTATSPVTSARLDFALLWGRLLPVVAGLWFWLGTVPLYRRCLYAACLAASVFVGLDVVVQAAFGRDIFGFPPYASFRFQGMFADPVAGLYLTHMLPLGLLLFAELDRWRPRHHVAFLSLLIGGLAVVFLTGERLFFGYTALGSLALMILVYRVYALAGILAVGLLMALGASLQPDLAERYGSVTVSELARLFRQLGQGEIKVSDGASYADYLIRGWQAATTHPMFGMGIQGFRGFCQEVLGLAPAVADYRSGCAHHPHHTWLNWAVVGGVPGLLMALALYGSLLAQLWRPVARKGKPIDQRSGNAHWQRRTWMFRLIGLWGLLPMTLPLINSESIFINYTEMVFWFTIAVLLMSHNALTQAKG